MALTLILGNQLFPEWIEPSEIQLSKQDSVLMVEDFGLAKHFRYHQLRIIHTFVAMREFKDQLQKHRIKVRYCELEESKDKPLFDRI
jgi:deoxyribodipyrimidine photolyase-related protein